SPAILRDVERQIMLRIIDQRWREHLYEMDYLQEGINLRAMGQKDPLVEWQREGFEMFGEMMKGIARDFVRYVMHVQVVVNQPAPAVEAAPQAAVEAAGPATASAQAPPEAAAAAPEPAAATAPAPAPAAKGRAKAQPAAAKARP